MREICGNPWISSNLSQRQPLPQRNQARPTHRALWRSGAAHAYNLGPFVTPLQRETVTGSEISTGKFTPAHDASAALVLIGMLCLLADIVLRAWHLGLMIFGWSFFSVSLHSSPKPRARHLSCGGGARHAPRLYTDRAGIAGRRVAPGHEGDFRLCI